ncbi:MAG: hypothetical protein RML93_08430 [Anaerolineales bacterium]|nr:hypothetical protein [Anaerolineales bacterium]MCS7247327.1 hypothetical protein [Anaerolineales bacterium]MDW8161138.1 hypothetical protein [Anaerolineales bacterium]MDW8447302.1 hypothetical protein [Anaerolineales bacterium]
MIVAKQVADWITFARFGIGVFLVFLGITRGAEALPLVIWLMLADWVGDFLDGNLARCSRVQYKSWIGEHDLHVDMSVATGLLLYFISSRILSPWRGWLYLVLWGVLFLWLGIPSSLGMLYQAPVYGYLLWISLSWYPALGWWLVAYLGTVIVITWPKFPKQVVPGFLYGFREIRLSRTKKLE